MTEKHNADPVDLPDPLRSTVIDAQFVCPRCGALLIVKREQLSNRVRCLSCLSMFPPDVGAQAAQRLRSSFEALSVRTARIRLRWDAGYVSEFPNPLDQDIAAVMFNPKTGMLTLRAIEGQGDFRQGDFKDSGEKDDDGYLIYREVPFFVENASHSQAAASPSLLLSAETFDYVAIMPTKGSEGRCQTRSTCGPEEASNQRQLVGGSPLFHVESVGLLRGGGPLSPLCEVIRPTVLASRIVLTAVDPGEALASAAWFHLDQSLVDVLCEGDTINLSRTPRGGLGLSVIRGQDLIIALGAVTAVPLGGQLKVTVRRDKLVRSLSLGGSTPGPWRHPVEITSLDRVPRKPRGYRTEGSAPENADECVLIVRTGACPDVAASASAQLLALSDALHLER